MESLRLRLLALLLWASWPALANSQESHLTNETHRAAALQMLELSGFYESYPLLHTKVVEAITEQNPGMRVHADMIEAFLASHIGTETMAAQTANAISARLSKQELDEINRFLRSSSGQKYRQLSNTLLNDIAHIYQQEVRRIEPELLQAIEQRRLLMNAEADRRNAQERMVHQQYLQRQ